MWISQAKAARHPDVNVSKQRINELTKEGRLSKNEKKQVDLDEVLRFFKKDRDPAWTESPLVQSAKNAAGAHTDDDAALEADASNYRASKARSEEIKARMAEMEYEQKLGMLVPKQEVLDAMVTSGRNIRQVIEGIVNWADDIAGITGTAPVEIRKFLAAKKRELQQAVADRLNVAGDEPAAVHGDA